VEENGGKGSQVGAFSPFFRALAHSFGKKKKTALVSPFFPLKSTIVMFFNIDCTLSLLVCAKRTCKVQLT